MSHMNILNFPDYMFALSLLHTIEDNFWKRKQQKKQELCIPREQMNLVLEKSISALHRITVKYLHFALVSMETGIP